MPEVALNLNPATAESAPWSDKRLPDDPDFLRRVYGETKRFTDELHLVDCKCEYCFECNKLCSKLTICKLKLDQHIFIDLDKVSDLPDVYPNFWEVYGHEQWHVANGIWFMELAKLYLEIATRDERCTDFETCKERTIELEGHVLKAYVQFQRRDKAHDYATPKDGIGCAPIGEVPPSTPFP